MNKAIAILGSLLIPVLSGCASMDGDTDWDTAADFSKLKTYSWTSETQERTGDPRLDNSLLDSRIRKAVDQVLAAKGYEKQIAGTGTSDFWVSYHAAIMGRLNAMTIYEPYYDATPVMLPNHQLAYNGPYSTWGRATTFADFYDEGTLILDMADPKTRKLLWRGTMSSVVESFRSPEEKEQRIQTAIEKLLEQFPPQPRPVS